MNTANLKQHPLSFDVWDQWNLSSLLKGLKLDEIKVGNANLSTTLLFLVLKEHDWPGSIGLFRLDSQDIAFSVEIQHTCLLWKNEVLDIHGRDHEAFAISEGLHPNAEFIPMTPTYEMASLSVGLPNFHQVLTSRVQAFLMQGGTPHIDVFQGAAPRARL